MSAPDFDDVVRQDFFFLLDLCKDIDEAFEFGSHHHTLAKSWMNHLCTYNVNTLPERRLKNIYLSHLCAATYQSKLYGPFLQPPKPGKLENVDFMVTPPQQTSQMSTQQAQMPMCPSSSPCPQDMNAPQCRPPTGMQCPPSFPNASQSPQQGYMSNVGSQSGSTHFGPQNSQGAIQQNFSVNPSTTFGAPQQNSYFQSPLAQSTPIDSTSGIITENQNQVLDQAMFGATFAQSPSQCMTPTLPGACVCPPTPCNCGATGACQCNRTAGGSELNGGRNVPAIRHQNASVNNKNDLICNYLLQELNFSPDFLMDFDATLTSFMNLCNVKCMEGRTKLTNNNKLTTKNTEHYHHVLPKCHPLVSQSNINGTSTSTSTSTSNSAALSAATKQSDETLSVQYRNPNLSSIQSPLNTQPTECLPIDMKELLTAISAELRGDAEPGNNDFLERELSRYKPFLMSKPNIGKYLETLKSGMKLRHFLLLSLQKDIIKMLSETM